MTSVPIFNLAGKVALITGAGRGIGKALALAFAEAGADVSICSRAGGDGELGVVADEIRKLGRRALAIRADVSRRRDVEDMVKRTVAELGGIDILINNAGICPLGLLLGTDEELWDSVIDIDLKGYYLCCRAVGKLMVERKKGTIINIASTAGLRPAPHHAAYSIAKAGVVMLTRLLARELGGCGIRVNAIAPWTVKTILAEPLLSNPEYVKTALAGLPLGRFGETGDIVGAALFLASWCCWRRSSNRCCGRW